MATAAVLIRGNVYEQKYMRFFCGCAGETRVMDSDFYKRTDAIACCNPYEYRDVIQQANLIFFLFDAKLFVENEAYRQRVWDDAEQIDRHCRNQGSKELRVAGLYSLEYGDNVDEFQLVERINEMSSRKPFRALLDFAVWAGSQKAPSCSDLIGVITNPITY